jgi:hypothetical protein
VRLELRKISNRLELPVALSVVVDHVMAKPAAFLVPILMLMQFNVRAAVHVPVI